MLSRGLGKRRMDLGRFFGCDGYALFWRMFLWAGNQVYFFLFSYVSPSSSLHLLRAVSLASMTSYALFERVVEALMVLVIGSSGSQGEFEVAEVKGTFRLLFITSIHPLPRDVMLELIECVVSLEDVVCTVLPIAGLEGEVVFVAALVEDGTVEEERAFIEPTPYYSVGG